MHGEHRGADINSLDAGEGREDGADGGAAGGIVLDAELLHGHIVDFSEGAELRRGAAVGGVAHVGVVLNDGALVERGAVGLVVLLGIEGVEAVGAVNGEQEGVVDGRDLEARVAVGDVVDELGDHRAAGALAGRRADLLVVKESDDGDHIIVGGAERLADERLGGAEAREEVVDAGGADELVVGAGDSGGLRVDDGEVKVLDVVGAAAGLLGEVLEQDAVVALDINHLAVRGVGLVEGVGRELRGHEGDQVGLLVGGEGLALLRGGEVDGEVGEDEELLVDLDELGLEGALAAALEEDAAGDGELAVKPRVPQTTTIALHRDALEAGALGAGLGLHGEVRAVGVGADDLDAVAGLVAAADAEGDDAAVVAGKVRLLAGGEVGPRAGGGEAGVADALQLRSDGLNGMEGGDGLVDERGKLLRDGEGGGEDRVGDLSLSDRLHNS